MSESASSHRGLLGWIERTGNRLPDPTTLFFLGTALVLVLSHLASVAGWSVTGTVIDRATGEAAEQSITAKSLLTKDGVGWVILNLEKNFMTFPPLGVVLVGMLGVGVAERTGFIGVCLKGFAARVPDKLLTPAMVFLGIMSSAASDAGYIVLPPLAAALYLSVGRSPLAGMAAVFAGVSAGFNANLLPTSLDPMLSRLSQEGARILEPGVLVSPTCNYYFLAVSTVVLTLTGWWVTARRVEPRLASLSAEEGGPAPARRSDREAQRLDANERRGLAAAGWTVLLTALVYLALVLIPGAPLHGKVGSLDPSHAAFDRWVAAIVPLIMGLFLLPGIAYGVRVGMVKSDKDLARLFIESMAAMAPIIVLAFFAGQFIGCFNESRLGLMLALSGGKMLTAAQFHPFLLLTAFIGVTMLFNLFVGSMSAKYAIFAPVFVPMFMMVGIDPEVTQVAYRIGDSTTNIITPLNAYLVIILAFMRRFVPKAGMGTLIATMLPYTVAFTLVWLVMLLAWLGLGVPLGF